MSVICVVRVACGTCDVHVCVYARECGKMCFIIPLTLYFPQRRQHLYLDSQNFCIVKSRT